jgi:hypothetical protein
MARREDNRRKLNGVQQIACGAALSHLVSRKWVRVLAALNLLNPALQPNGS